MWDTHEAADLAAKPCAEDDPDYDLNRRDMVRIAGGQAIFFLHGSAAMPVLAAGDVGVLISQIECANRLFGKQYEHRLAISMGQQIQGAFMLPTEPALFFPERNPVYVCAAQGVVSILPGLIFLQDVTYDDSYGPEDTRDLMEFTFQEALDNASRKWASFVVFNVGDEDVGMFPDYGIEPNEFVSEFKPNETRTDADSRFSKGGILIPKQNDYGIAVTTYEIRRERSLAYFVAPNSNQRTELKMRWSPLP